MYGFLPPTFPAFAWNEHFWATSAKLPAWSGYQIRNGPYGRVSQKGRSDGTVHIIFAPEGQDNSPLSGQETKLVKWLIDNQEAVHDSMLEKLFDEYPAMRDEALDWFEEDEETRVLPAVRYPEQLKDIVGISTVFVHQIEKGGKPFIGVELGRTWQVGHGLGILLCGSIPLEIGGAETAFTIWIAKKYAGNSMDAESGDAGEGRPR